MTVSQEQEYLSQLAGLYNALVLITKDPFNNSTPDLAEQAKKARSIAEALEEVIQEYQSGERKFSGESIASLLEIERLIRVVLFPICKERELYRLPVVEKTFGETATQSYQPTNRKNSI